jgi:hypothetical protein
VLKLLIVELHNKTKSNGGAFELGHISSGEEGKKMLMPIIVRQFQWRHRCLLYIIKLLNGKTMTK